MAAQQTSVDFSGPAFAGQLADTGPYDTASALVEDASNEIPFGVLVVRGTADNQCKLPAAQADVTILKTLGIVKHGFAYAKDTELGDNGLKRYATASVVKHGRMRVYSSEAVAVSDAVRVRATNNAGAAGSATLGPGTFCKSAAANHTMLLTKGARWVAGAAAGGYPILEFDIDSLVITADV